MVMLTGQQLKVAGRLQAVDFHLSAGELVGVIGPNGAGKSTLLACLAGLEAGAGTQSVQLHGQPLYSQPARARARALGFLPQQVDSAWDLLVGDVVALGRLPWGAPDPAHVAVAAAMRQTDIWHLRERRVRALSGGEWARVCMARVLAGTPDVILADEPVSHLDFFHQHQVMQVLRDHARGRRAAVVALHDLGLAARYCDRLLLLTRGRVAAEGVPATVLTPLGLEAAYGVAMHVDLKATPPVVLPA